MSGNPKRPSFGSVDHIALEVNDIKTALHFYNEVLGLSLLPMPSGLSEKGIYWFSLGKNLALHIVHNKEAAPGKTAHIAIEVADVEKWRSYFTVCGIEVQDPAVAVYTAERIFVRDPSGNRIEFVKWLTSSL